MKQSIFNVKNYKVCLKEILKSTFEDKQIRHCFINSSLLLILGIISNVFIPFLLKESIESFSHNPSTLPILILLGYGVMWTISHLFLHLRSALTFKIEQRLITTLGIKVLSHILGFSQHYFINHSLGELTNIMRRIQRNIPPIILGVFFHALPTFIEFVVVSILIFKLYPLIYSFILIGTMFVFFTYTLLSLKKALKKRELANFIDQKVDGTLTDLLSNQEIIKTFGKSSSMINLCKMELNKRENAEVSAMTQLNFTYTGQCFILGIGLTLLTYLIGQGILKGTLTTGDFVLFNGYILQFINPLSILGQLTHDVKKSFLDMKTILDILLIKSDIKEAQNPKYLKDNSFNIEFNNVSFSYENRKILKDVFFKVEEGETLLILGPTGSGKSTIAKLLLRLYDPCVGKILINNINLRDISFHSLYSTIGWVPQDTYLLNDTLQNNLLFFCPKASKKDIMTALEKACLSDLMAKLPKGLETIIGNRGLKLSGGERQRIALARLFLKQPKICIFDEATSFLDQKTDKMVQHSIKNFLPNMTKLIITHRPFILVENQKILTLHQQECPEVSFPHTNLNKNIEKGMLI